MEERERIEAKIEFSKRARKEIKSNLEGILPMRDGPPRSELLEHTEAEWEQKRQESKAFRQARRITELELVDFLQWNRPNKRQMLNELLIPSFVKYLKIGDLADTRKARSEAELRIEAAVLQYFWDCRGIDEEQLMSAWQTTPAITVNYDMVRELEEALNLPPWDISPDFETELPPMYGLVPLGIPIAAEDTIRQQHISIESKARELANAWYDLSASRAYEFLILRLLMDDNIELNVRNKTKTKGKGSPISVVLAQFARDREYPADEVDFFRRLRP